MKKIMVLYIKINDMTKKIGTIYPRGEAVCYAIVDGKYLVCYNVYSGNTVANRKNGFYFMRYIIS